MQTNGIFLFLDMELGIAVVRIPISVTAESPSFDTVTLQVGFLKRVRVIVGLLKELIQAVGFSIYLVVPFIIFLVRLAGFGVGVLAQ